MCKCENAYWKNMPVIPYTEDKFAYPMESLRKELNEKKINIENYAALISFTHKVHRT